MHRLLYCIWKPADICSELEVVESGCGVLSRGRCLKKLSTYCQRVCSQKEKSLHGIRLCENKNKRLNDSTRKKLCHPSSRYKMT